MVGADGSTLTIFKMYSGNCSLMLLFIASLIYLWVVEKNKERRAILVFVSVTVLALFFLPVLSDIVINTMGEEEVYYRLLWALPMGFVISYAAVKFLCSVKKKWLRIILLCCLCVYIVWGGQLIYKSPQFSKAENVYQVPDAVVHICDAIEVPGREVVAVFPNELIQYVRQYSPYVVMPYGYDVLVQRWLIRDALEEEMSKDVSDAKILAEMSRERGCHFIVLNQNHLLDGDLGDYDYILILQTDGYDVYRDKYADLSLNL